MHMWIRIFTRTCPQCFISAALSSFCGNFSSRVQLCSILLGSICLHRKWAHGAENVTLISSLDLKNTCNKQL